MQNHKYHYGFIKPFGKIPHSYRDNLLCYVHMHYIYQAVLGPCNYHYWQWKLIESSLRLEQRSLILSEWSFKKGELRCWWLSHYEFGLSPLFMPRMPGTSPSLALPGVRASGWPASAGSPPSPASASARRPCDCTPRPPGRWDPKCRFGRSRTLSAPVVPSVLSRGVKMVLVHVTQHWYHVT